AEPARDAEVVERVVESLGRVPAVAECETSARMHPQHARHRDDLRQRTGGRQDDGAEAEQLAARGGRLRRGGGGEQDRSDAEWDEAVPHAAPGGEMTCLTAWSRGGPAQMFARVRRGATPSPACRVARRPTYIRHGYIRHGANVP